jgi:hypothetical protein
MHTAMQKQERGKSGFALAFSGELQCASQGLNGRRKRAGVAIIPR